MKYIVGRISLSLLFSVIFLKAAPAYAGPDWDGAASPIQIYGSAYCALPEKAAAEAVELVETFNGPAAGEIGSDEALIDELTEVVQKEMCGLVFQNTHTVKVNPCTVTCMKLYPEMSGEFQGLLQGR